MSDIDALLEELRAPLRADGRAHLNNAGVAPCSARAVAEGKRTFERMTNGSFGVLPLLADYTRARATFARLVAAESGDDIAFFQTCAVAISQAALGISLSQGDEIVSIDQEYPSNGYPWHRAAERAGARVVVVKSDLDYQLPTERILDAITPRTRVVAISWVQFSTGTNFDLRAIADRLHGVREDSWLFVDAIQGLGIIPFDLRASGVDVLAGGTHKWCVGPLGHGFLAFAAGKRTRVAPLLHGAMTYGTPDDLVDPTRTVRDDPRRFEPGAPLVLGALAGAAAIELLLEIGIDRVQREALALADVVAERARERGLRVLAQSGPARSPITALRLKDGVDPKPIIEAMKARGVFTGNRAGGIRVAPHVHNTLADVDKLFRELDSLGQ